MDKNIKNKINSQINIGKGDDIRITENFDSSDEDEGDKFFDHFQHSVNQHSQTKHLMSTTPNEGDTSRSSEFE